MAGRRRTEKEIAEVEAIAQATYETARDISRRVNGDEEGDPYVHVSACNIGGVKAEYQRGHAKVIVVSYDTKDPVLAEKVAAAIREAVLADTARRETRKALDAQAAADAAKDEDARRDEAPR